MKKGSKNAHDRVNPKQTQGPTSESVNTIAASLKRLANKNVRDDMGSRYGIHTNKAFGVPVGALQKLAKQLGRNHDLALALWDTGWYEARMLAAYVDEPERVTLTQLDCWCRDFDNWGICDTACFVLFDRAPHAWSRIAPWAKRSEEFVKRAAFALLASLALHDKSAADASFIRFLPQIERAAGDERNFVKKGVSWALRAIGRRNAELNAIAVALAKQLAASSDGSKRWVGKDALKDLAKPQAVRQLAARTRRAPKSDGH